MGQESNKMFSKDNNMDPGELPTSLKDHTKIEQQLMFSVAPWIPLQMLNHGGLSSQTVTLPQETRPMLNADKPSATLDP